MAYPNLSLEPQDVTVGARASIEYRFVPAQSAPAFAEELAAGDPRLEKLNESGFFTVLSARIENGASGAAVFLEIIPWKSGEIQIPPLEFASAEGAALKVEFPPFFIRSVAEESGATQLAPPAPPVVIPGTTYAIYGILAGGALLLFLAALLLLRIKKLRNALRALGAHIRRSGNHRRVLKKLRLFSRRKFATDSEGATMLALAVRAYLEKRFKLPFCSCATSEIAPVFRANFGGFYDLAAANMLDVLRRCDEVRFSVQAATFAESETTELALKLASSIEELEGEMPESGEAGMEAADAAL